MSAAFVVAAALGACGDPLLTAQDRGDGVFGVHGSVQQRDHGLPSADYEVAVMYLRAVLDITPRSGLPYRVETEVIPGALDGSLPADFRVELIDAPKAYRWENLITYRNLGDTAPSEGVFSTTHAPDGVRVGQLMIGPAKEIADLPKLVDFAPSEPLSLHRALVQFLPNTTITAYQVIYAQGVEAGDVIYPTHIPGKTEASGGIEISNGFTLVDARAYFAGTKWQACAASLSDTPLDPLYDRDAYAACLAANSELIDCLATCSVDACQRSCRAAFPTQVDQDRCMSRAAFPRLEASCDAVRSPRPYQVQVLNQGATLQVVLGDDDIEAGLRILQSTTL